MAYVKAVVRSKSPSKKKSPAKKSSMKSARGRGMTEKQMLYKKLAAMKLDGAKIKQYFNGRSLSQLSLDQLKTLHKNVKSYKKEDAKKSPAKKTESQKKLARSACPQHLVMTEGKRKQELTLKAVGEKSKTCTYERKPYHSGSTAKKSPKKKSSSK